MKNIILLLALLAATIVPSGRADAAVIGVYDFDYTDIGNRDGQGRDQDATGVLIADDGTTFRDTFDFGDLAGATIDALTLTFRFSGAGPTNLLGTIPFERWFVTVEGNDPAGTGDDLFATLVDAQSPWTGAITAGTAPGNTFFDDALDALAFDFSFDDTGIGIGNSFRLAGVTLTVDGTSAVVPLPAPGLLLLAALGGLGLMRRRRRATAA